MGTEKFDSLDDAVEKAKQIEGIVISYNILKSLDGKYAVDIDVYDAYDGLTRYVFVSVENEDRLRDVITENENTYYEDTKNKDFRMHFECNSFVEAKKKFEEIVEKIIEDRKKVRISAEEGGYIVF
jgi:hypothetical protein